MSTETRDKTLHYRRALWTDDVSRDLEALLRDAYKQLDSTKKRNFVHGDKEIMGLKPVKHSGGGISGQVEAYTVGQPKTALDAPAEDESTDISSAMPPAEKNFTDGEVFFYVKKNHVVICPSGSNEALASRYFRELLLRIGEEEAATALSVKPVIPRDTRRRLIKEKVKRFEMDLISSKADMHKDQRSFRQLEFRERMTEDVKKFFKSLGARYPSLKEIELTEHVDVRMILSFDKRRKNAELAEDELTDFTNTMLGEDEDQNFALITGKNNPIRNNQLRLRKTVTLTKYNETVTFASARAAMAEYLLLLHQDGEIDIDQ